MRRLEKMATAGLRGQIGAKVKKSITADRVLPWKAVEHLTTRR